MKQVRKNLMLAIQLTCFITVPAVIGMSLLSKPIYIMFFNSTTPGYNEYGGAIFQLGAILGLFMALYSIITAILQGIGGQWYGILFLGIALVIKYIGNVLLIPTLQANGATISTMIAYTVCISCSLYVIKRKTGFKLLKLARRLVAIFVFAFIMGLVVEGLKLLLNQILPYQERYIFAVVHVGVAGVIGAGLYFGLAWYFDLINHLFGTKFSLESLKRRILKKK